MPPAGSTPSISAGTPRFTTAGRSQAADVRASMLRALAPGSTGGRSWPLYPILGARAYAAGKAKEVAGIAVPDDSTVVLTLEEPLNVFPKLLAMPVAAIVPTPTPPDFDQQPDRQRPLEVCVLVARRRDRPGPERDATGAAPRKSDTLRIRIIPEPLTQAAEYEAGQLSVVEVPVGETRRWEQSHAGRAPAPPGAARPLRGHQHHPRPAARTFGCGGR